MSSTTENEILHSEPKLTHEEQELAKELDNFNPMEDDFNNPEKHSYYNNSIGSTIPKNLQFTGKGAKDVKAQLYVQNIDLKLTEEGLFRIFNRYGEVCTARITSTKKSDALNSNIGFVLFKSQIEANRAIISLNNRPPYNFKIQYSVSEEEKKERRAIQCIAEVDFAVHEMNNYDKSTAKDDERIKYYPCPPADFVNLSEIPSLEVDTEPYHLYDTLPTTYQFLEPYLLDHDDINIVNKALHKYLPRFYHDIKICSDSLTFSVNQKINADGKVFDELIPSKPSETSQTITSFQKIHIGRNYKKQISSKICISCNLICTSPAYCQCGTPYCGAICQNKDFIQHKIICAQLKRSEKNVGKSSSINLIYNNFTKIQETFKKFQEYNRTILNQIQLNSPLEIVPDTWFHDDTFVGHVFTADLREASNFYITSPVIQASQSLTADEVEIGDMIGVENQRYANYVRGYVADKTRDGLIVVLLLELGTVAITGLVKRLPSRFPYWKKYIGNVKGRIIRNDVDLPITTMNFKCVNILPANGLQCRYELDECKRTIIELNPYVPMRQQLPIQCILVNDGSNVVITSVHSAQAIFVQPTDDGTQFKYVKMLSELNSWCEQNHAPIDHVPARNTIVGVKLQNSGKYHRGQIIGRSRNTKVQCDVMYLVCLIDSGNNMLFSPNQLVNIPDHFQVGPCFCRKICLRNTSLHFNRNAFNYLDEFISGREPLVITFEEDLMTANLIFNQNIEEISICEKLESLCGAPSCAKRHSDVLESIKLKVPIYSLNKGDEILLKIVILLDVNIATVLVLNKEAMMYVQNILTPQFQIYCDSLTCDTYNPPIGGFCLVYCKDTKIWYRAVNHGDSQLFSGYCFVKLIDYGISAHVPLAHIRPIHHKFTLFESLAFRAYIPEFGVKELKEDEILKTYGTYKFTVSNKIPVSDIEKEGGYILQI